MPLADWTLETLHARGASSDVWRARDRHGVPAVVKVARSDTPSVRAAFRREADALGRLDHPGVVDLLEAGHTGRRPWLALRDGGGRHLGRWAARHHRDWWALRAALLQLLDALGHVHEAGLIHLDVKPSNVVLASGGDPRVTLVDFGLARDRRGEGPQRASGTPSYMAPEQVRASWRHIGPWTDLYGLGGLAWRVLTGRHAIDVSAARSWGDAQLELRPGAFRPRTPVPAGLEDWLRRLLAKRPARRFLSAPAARAALLALGAPSAHRIVRPTPVVSLAPAA